MSISTQTSNGNTITTITRTTPTAKAAQTLDDFIRGLHAGSYAIYPRNAQGELVNPANINNANRLLLLEAFITEAVMKVVRNYRIEAAAEEARTTEAANLPNEVEF